MPELPEVETIKTQLELLIVGKKILSMGAKIIKIRRRAKLLQIFLNDGSLLVFHLKLTGRLLVRKNSDPEDDWQRITLPLSGGLELRFCDARKFGWMKHIKNEKELQKIVASFGPEANLITLDEFRTRCSATKRPIKVFLMDQTKIAGIGNIYVNDALNLAKINPIRPANNLTQDEQKKLLTAIQKVLKAGLKHGGASDQYYLDAKGAKGHYQDHFLVYNRAGKKCFECGGVIKRITLAGRGTYFCSTCQV